MIVEKDILGKNTAYPFGKIPGNGTVDSIEEDKCRINVNFYSVRTFDEAIHDLNKVIEAVKALQKLYLERK
jgi:hypothetical protein